MLALAKLSEYPYYKHTYVRKMALGLSKECLKMKDSLSETKIESLKSLKTLRELDDLITTPKFLYESTDHYYAMESSKHYIPKIKIPYLILNSLDDPIVPAENIAVSECLSNPNIILALTEFGGHGAWYEGWNPYSKTYSDTVALSWFNAVLKQE